MAEASGIPRREFMRRGLALGLGSTMLGGLLSACGGVGSAAGGAGGKELTVWAWQPAGTGYPAVFADIGKQWSKKQPGRKYKYNDVEFTNYFTKFKTVAAGNIPPDVMEMSWTGEYHALIEAGMLESVDDLLPQLPKFFPIVAESLEYHGKTYGVPMDVNTLTVAYNKEIFAKLGLTPPSTLDEMLALAEPIRKAGYQPLALPIKELWPCADVWFAQVAYTDSSNKAIREAEAKALPWTAPPFMQAAEALERIQKSGILADGSASLDTNTTVAVFGKQKAAMMYPAGNFLTSLINTAAGGKFTYGLFPFPPLTEGQKARATGGPAVIWSIPSKAKNLAGAREYLKFATDSQTYAELVPHEFIPAAPADTSSNKNPIYQAMIGYQAEAATRAIFLAEVYTALENASSALLSGQGSAKSVGAAMAKAA